MADSSFTDQNKINAIIDSSTRLKYILTATYQVPLNDIISIRVDSDNFKIDINTATDMFRFKSQDLEHVIMTNLDLGVPQLTFDPALAQAIYNIADEYGA